MATKRSLSQETCASPKHGEYKEMKTVSRPFQLTSTQRWKAIGYGAAVVLGLFVLAAIFSDSLSDETGSIATLIVFGLLVGTTVRLSIRRGWVYYAERYRPGSPFVFTRALKLGALWRSLVIWFGGRFVTIVLLDQADSDVGLGLLALVSLSLVMAASLTVGLRFGWRSADSALANDALLTASD